jgi:NADH-ubiquinone oxidoreductase chain 2
VYLAIDWYFFEKSIGIFNVLISVNLNHLVFIFFLFVLCKLIFVLTSFYPINTNILKTKKKNLSTIISLQDIMQIKRDHYLLIEYSLIVLFILVGSISLLSSYDIVTIFLCIELQSYGLYILCTLYRNSESSTNAGLTYFLLGGLSSCIILLGLSYLYVNTGATNLDAFFGIHNIINSNDNLAYYMTTLGKVWSNSMLYSIIIFSLNYYQYALQFAFVIVAIGFLFKISAAPFHSWSPGVYDSIPTVTTTFVAIIPKISIFMLFFDLVYSTWYTTFNHTWINVLFFSSLLSLIVGSIAGLTQFRIKRLYAYSTVSHVGFILLALCVHNVESIQAFFFYIIQYSLSNLNAFLILILIGYSFTMYQKKTKVYESSIQSKDMIFNEYKAKIKELSPLEFIDSLKGYFYLNPVLSLSLAITLFSFIGVPPLVGFFAKQMILSSALDNGDIFMCLIAILTSVISAVYYLYIVKNMFFEKSNYMVNTVLTNVLSLKLEQLNPISNSNHSVKSQSSTSTVTFSVWLNFIISLLSLITFLFMFLYIEIYLLMSILSVITIY